MPSVVVVGAINVDLVVATARLPGPGETVVGARMVQHGGGKGANAAVAAARAGAAVRLIGAVGTDDTAVTALRELRAEGVDVGGVRQIGGEATGVALIVVDDAGENQIAVGAGANAVLSGGWVEAQLREMLPDTGCVLVSTEIPGAAVAAAVRAAAHAGVPCLLNCAPPIPAVAQLLDQRPVLTPNASELAELAAMLDVQIDVPDGADVVARAQAQAQCLLARTGTPLVVTLGAAGALVVAPDAEPLHVPPRLVEVCDTTGAGDTFNGVLAFGVARADDFGSAALRAAAAASLSISHPGARGGMPCAADIDAALQAR